MSVVLCIRGGGTAARCATCGTKNEHLLMYRKNPHAPPPPPVMSELLLLP